MLLNLSNHPSSQWPEKQYEAAIEQFGGITDIPFPAIEPTADDQEVLLLARHYASLCIRQLASFSGQKTQNAVHVMGELTFCFAVVSLLQKDDIRCVASTTVRMATQHGNTRTSHFAFARFRDYNATLKK